MKWIVDNFSGCLSGGYGSLYFAARHGNLKAVKWVLDHSDETGDGHAVRAAASAGWVDVVAYLHRVCSQSPSADIMDDVIDGEHTLVAMYLLGAGLATCSFVGFLESLLTYQAETNDLILLLIECADNAPVKLPASLLDLAVDSGVPLIGERLCVSLEVDGPTRAELVARAVAALRRKRLRA